MAERVHLEPWRFGALFALFVFVVDSQEEALIGFQFGEAAGSERRTWAGANSAGSLSAKVSGSVHRSHGKSRANRQRSCS